MFALPIRFCKLQSFDQKQEEKQRKAQSKANKKYLKDLPDSIREQFERSLSIQTGNGKHILPKCLRQINGKILEGMLTILLHFRHQKVEQIDGENEYDFILHLFGILMLECNEIFHAEKYLQQSVMKKNNCSYGHVFADLCLLKIKQRKFIEAWQYIQIALAKKHTEAYNRLIALILHWHLTQIDLDNHECANQFDLSLLLCAKYFHQKAKEKQRTKVDEILSHYFDAMIHFKKYEWKECMAFIDKIYQNIHAIDLTKITNECAQIIVKIKRINQQIKNENTAMIKSANECKYERDDDEKEFV